MPLTKEANWNIGGESAPVRLPSITWLHTTLQMRFGTPQCDKAAARLLIARKRVGGSLATGLEPYFIDQPAGMRAEQMLALFGPHIAQAFHGHTRATNHQEWQKEILKKKSKIVRLTEKLITKTQLSLEEFTFCSTLLGQLAALGRGRMLQVDDRGQQKLEAFRNKTLDLVETGYVPHVQYQSKALNVQWEHDPNSIQSENPASVLAANAPEAYMLTYEFLRELGRFGWMHNRVIANEILNRNLR